MKRIIHILIVALVAFTFTAGASRAVAETPAEQVEAAKVAAQKAAAAAAAAEKAVGQAEKDAKAAADAEAKAKTAQDGADAAADAAKAAKDKPKKEADKAQKDADKAKKDADSAAAAAKKAGEKADASQAEAEKKVADAEAAKKDAEKKVEEAEKAVAKVPDSKPVEKRKLGEKLDEVKDAVKAAGKKTDEAKKGAEAGAKTGDEKSGDAKKGDEGKKEGDAGKAGPPKAEPPKAVKPMTPEEAEAARKSLEKIKDTLKGFGDQLLGVGKRLGELFKRLPFAEYGKPFIELLKKGLIGAKLDGTGETIGHVANLTLTNPGTERVRVVISPTLLIPGSAERQTYALTGTHLASVGAGETVTIPLDGVCLDAHKPPVTPGDTVGLTIADPATLPQASRDLLAGAQKIATAARTLQAAGKFQTPFSGNPAKELQTIVQWATWTSVANKTDNPLTKADFAAKVYEQAGVPRVADGLVSTVFTVPQGKIRVHLPNDMAAGDTISGTVVAEPKGTSAAERQKNAETLNGFVIEVAGQKGPAASRAFTGMVPDSFAGNPTMILNDSKGTTIGKVTIPKPSKSAAKKTDSPATSEFKLPTFGQAGRPLEITGPFDGNASNTNVRIGDQELAILVESRSRTVVQSPKAPAGPAEIVLKEGGNEFKGTFTSKTATDAPEQKTSATKSQASGPQQQKLDKGIDDLWGAIQLTGAEAKVL